MELLPSLLSALKAEDPATLYQEYTTVRSQTSVFKRELGLTTEDGALKENIKKNRYKDILPYDQSRVVVSLLTADTDSDYINASFIRGASSECRYIASQAPLSSTLTDFWRMIWQYDVKVIVMACREVEMGRKKCERYWSPVHQSAAFGPFSVCNQGETHPNEHVVIRDLTVTYQQVTRALTQYQFLSWPDHDVPYEAEGVLDLLQRARESQGTHTSPLLVHCSAGCGRTGVICALDYIHDLLVTKNLAADFSIMEIVQELRKQRPSSVQTKEQYQFICTTVAFMFERFLQQSAGEPHLYSNLTPPNIPEPTRTPACSSQRPLSLQPTMDDTYAVVNKNKLPPSNDPTYSVVSARSSRTLPPASHHYDNDPSGASASAPAPAPAPVYSTVRPRSKPNSLPLSATPIYDIAAPPTNHSAGEYSLVPEQHFPATDDDYEDFSTSVTDVSSICSPGGIGFNCRIQKPRGPREPPAAWSRLER
ncbi:hypothetical protein CesoFtcFv8_011907 [Champsocephalus esox]|uniref:protein-tyrosine-phosphatase n=1 Tax=Champsocephalus esox TaxID=159716 RepID=A0AAN8C0J4_9TELE|nr:hypothetical protein CesoFtcFv8_011907 [Champsocephalus esox]